MFNRICNSPMIAVLFLMVVGLSITSAFGQRSRSTVILLAKDADKNGYSLVREGGSYFFRASGVENPLPKKLLEGKHTLSYACENPAIPVTMRSLVFTGGSSARTRVSCSVMLEPKIILLDEPNPNED